MGTKKTTKKTPSKKSTPAIKTGVFATTTKQIIDLHKKNFGRPPKYSPEMCESVIEIMGNGESKTAVCARLGISMVTLYEWINEKGDYYKPDFSNAIKIGEVLSLMWWENVGKTSIKNKDFNVGNYAIQMANRFNWTRKDRTEIDIKKTENKNLSVTFNFNINEIGEYLNGLEKYGIISDVINADAEIN